MPKWVRRMPPAAIAEAKALSERHTEAQIVRMAVACVNRAMAIRLWFAVSCLVPVAVLAAPVFRPSVITDNFWHWLAAMAAAMLLPAPARVAADRCAAAGDVIAYAYWLKKDPSRLTRD